MVCVEEWAEIKAKGDFPLHRLSHAGIHFDEREANLIQAVHKVFWLAVVRTKRVPVAFEGTPLELWCMFTITFSENLGHMRHLIYDLSEKTGDRIFPDQITERDFNQASLEWKDPRGENTAMDIFQKICRPGSAAGISIDHTNIDRNWPDPSLENFEGAIRDIAPIAAQFGPSGPLQWRGPLFEGPLTSQVFTDDEINVMQINYSVIIWNQLLSGDMLMIPTPSVKPTYMEIYLLNYIVFLRIRLKANKSKEYYPILNAIIFHMHYPDKTKDEHLQNHYWTSLYFLHPARDRLMGKIAIRSRNWWTTMMSRHDRSDSPFKKLPLDIFREIDDMAFGKRLSLAWLYAAGLASAWLKLSRKLSFGLSKTKPQACLKLSRRLS